MNNLIFAYDSLPAEEQALQFAELLAERPQIVAGINLHPDKLAKLRANIMKAAKVVPSELQK